MLRPFTLVLLLSLTASDAEPCSIREAGANNDTPREGERVGSLPLLYGFGGQQPPSFNVLPASDVIAKNVGPGANTPFERPDQPLADGDYEFRGLHFTVDSTTADVPATLTPVSLAMTVNLRVCDTRRSEVSATVKGMDIVASRASLVRMSLRYEGAAAPYSAALLRPDLNGCPNDPAPNCGVMSLGLDPDRRGRICVSATPVSWSGKDGATIELGCLDPQGDDPRVKRYGCSAVADDPIAWLAVVFFVVGERARARLRARALAGDGHRLG